MVERITHYRPEPTDHSTLPMHQAFMKRVAAYDLPIGFCESFDDRDFWIKLIKKADWTSGWDEYLKSGVPKVPNMPDLINKETVQELDERFYEQQKKREMHR